MPMLTCSKRMPSGRGLAPTLVRRAATLSLDWDTRQKSRFQAQDSQGRQLAVFLPRGQVLRGGDVLILENGDLVRVMAAPQAVLRISACPQHGSVLDLARAAYHLGNRHVPLELQHDHLKIEPDHVLADMLRAQHLIVQDGLDAFEPESGAYASSAHAHAHAHAHEHEHGTGAQGPDPADPHARRA